jgi:hypothetical protein
MIEFRQKEFSEYDAMRYLWTELQKNDAWRRRIQIIGSNSLVPILKGNNIVIERFVISTRTFHKDRYRMYLKIGAKAKMPDAVRLPGQLRYNKLLGSSLKVGGSIFAKQKNNSEIEGPIIFKQKEFEEKKKRNNGGGGGPRPTVSTELFPLSGEIQYETTVPRGDTIDYDKKSRSIVLEFDTVQDAINALNILPFGLNYKVYLLDL